MEQKSGNICLFLFFVHLALAQVLIGKPPSQYQWNSLTMSSSGNGCETNQADIWWDNQRQAFRFKTPYMDASVGQQFLMSFMRDLEIFTFF
jgi:hypothetical protein